MNGTAYLYPPFMSDTHVGKGTDGLKLMWFYSKSNVTLAGASGARHVRVLLCSPHRGDSGSGATEIAFDMVSC